MSTIVAGSTRTRRVHAATDRHERHWWSRRGSRWPGRPTRVAKGEAAAEPHLADLRWPADGAWLRHRRADHVHPDHHDPVRDRVSEDRSLLLVAVRSHAHPASG